MKINIERDPQNKSDIVYIKNFEAPSRSLSIFELKGANHSYLSYIVFQLHSFHMNVSLSSDEKLGELSQREGTNLGLIVKADNFTKTLYLRNDNYDDVKCLVAVIAYNHSSPLPGGCSSGIPSLTFEEEGPFITVQSPQGKPFSEVIIKNETDCTSDSSLLRYETFFIYLDHLNFNSDIYFEGIRNLMYEGIASKGYKVCTTLNFYKRIMTEY